MTLDLAEPQITLAAAEYRDTAAQAHWQGRLRAVGSVPEPRVFADLAALRVNADAMTARSTRPIRIASKSVRSREILHAVQELAGYHGILAFSLAEAVWLARSDDYDFTDIVVAYPTTDTAAITELSRSESLARSITLMADSAEQLTLITAAATGRYPIRIAIDLDVSWRAPLLGHIGVRRSPLHTPDEAAAFAELVLQQPKLKLVGLMGYEAQIAGVGDSPRGKRLMGALLRQIQRRSLTELIRRRTEAVAAISQLTELEFVNGGGTGSLEQTSADRSVTEIAAGSGLFGPHLFDNYRSFTPEPAVFFALPVVRKALPGTATLLGGGWIASGPAGADRLPEIVWPQGLGYLPREGAGEVQTPVTGRAAESLSVGDAVLFRHTKAGEIAEHTNTIKLMLNEDIVAEALTYRGEGQVFL